MGLGFRVDGLGFRVSGNGQARGCEAGGAADPPTKESGASGPPAHPESRDYILL